VKIIDFFFAARPMLLLPVWSIFLITYKAHNSGEPNMIDFSVLLAVSFIFAGAYYINQIFDYESDLINKKLGFLQRGMISRKEMWTAYIGLSLISLLTAFIIGYLIGLLMVLVFLLGFAYSAPPMRFKDRPITGLLTNSIAYGLLLPLVVIAIEKRITTGDFMLPLYFFMAVSAGYLLTIIPDREGDMKSGKITLAAILPDIYLMLIALLLLYLSLMTALKIEHFYLAVISAVSIVLFLTAIIFRKIKFILFACKMPILLMSLLAGYYYPAYLIFILVLLVLTRLYYRLRFGIKYPGLN
jgi:4-hydroxybenzoate polyprenyltransferase